MYLIIKNRLDVQRVYIFNENLLIPNEPYEDSASIRTQRIGPVQ